MHVAFFSKFHPSVGGIERHVLELSRNLERIGVKATVYTSFFPRFYRYSHRGVSVVNIPRSVRLNGYYYFARALSPHRIASLLRAMEVNVIHGHLFSFSSEFLLPKIARNLKIPLVVTVHTAFGRGLIGGVVPTLSGVLLRRFFNEASAIIAVSPQLAEFFMRLGVRVTHVVPNGVNTERFSPGSSDFKNEIGADRLVVFVGRISWEKNLPLLFRAFKILSEKVSRVKLVIVGRGPLLGLYKSKFNLDNVIFTGYVNDGELIRILRSADVFVLPSVAESQGIVCLEAMACGVPVVASRIGGLPSSLEHGGGLLCDPFDPADMAKKILFFLSNPEKAREVGESGRRVVLQRFSWDKICRKMLSIYKALQEASEQGSAE